jgi:lipopolysaccharide/colanic/teichoic acid biosynthesis glycosyltransferase
VLDLVAASLALLLLSPVLMMIALLVRLGSGRPVLFRQARAGRGGCVFQIVKFRTMSEARGPGGALLPDGQRLTPLGRWLRRSSLDELPELWNVLRGDMSLVGPRPLLAEYLPRYGGAEARRHAVRPGITGWAQVNGRNDTTWPERFGMDVWYVDHVSLALDLRILTRTAWAVIHGGGISAGGHATMPEYTGTARTGGATETAEATGVVGRDRDATWRPQ